MSQTRVLSCKRSYIKIKINKKKQDVYNRNNIIITFLLFLAYDH